MTKTWRHFVIGLAAAACLAGCSTAPHVIKTDELPLESYPQMVVAEGLHRGIVATRPIVTASTDEKPMRVTVPTRSIHDSKPLHVQYKFEFFDKDMRPLRSNLGWKFITLAPRIQVFLEGNALETSAADWRLQVRPAK